MTTHENERGTPEPEEGNARLVLSRRRFGTMVAGGSAAAFLAACGGQEDSSSDEGDSTETDESSDDTSGSTDESDSDAAGDEGSGEEMAATGGVIRVAFPDPPNEFDPALYSAFPEYSTGYQIYDGMIRLDPALVPEPALAESWETSDDGLTWTFNLRSGVTWHDGSEFTADDVAYTFNRLIDPDVASPLAAALGILDSVEAIDASTAQFNLNSPNGDLIIVLGSPQARVVPNGRSQDDLRADPIGTGPFTFVEHVPGDHTTFAANPDYWGEGPFVDEVRFLAMPESTTQVAAIGGDQVDILWQVGTENLPALEGTAGVVVESIASGAYQTIAMQSDKAPFDDPRVRQALKMTVDRAGVQAIVLEGLGGIGNDHPVPDFNAFYNDGIPVRQPDIEGAKALLAEAGYPDGVDLTLTTSEVRAGMVPFATALQEMARPAGFNIELELAPPDTYWSEVWLNRPFFASNWGMRPSLDETFSIQFTSDAKWNEGNFGTDEIDAAVAAGRASSDPGERKAQYGIVQQGLHDEGGVVISYFRPVIQAFRESVSGYEPHPAQWVYLNNVKVG